jgi:hypothetical protein
MQAMFQHNVAVWRVKGSMGPCRWFPLRENLSTTVSRPLEWTVTPSQGQNVQIFLDILQEVVDSEPVNEQHTWITVVANCSCVQLGRLSSREESFSLAIQESPREDLV